MTLSRISNRPRKLSLLTLIAATYCMVCGGPFGLEDLVQKAGYLGAIVTLLLTPLLWGMPTAMMVSELASALPKEGGFYVWVSRGMGPFWGFQEAWLTFMGSIFDMAIYPTLFAWYVVRFWPVLDRGHIPLLIGVAMIVGCVLWNLQGAVAVGRGSIGVTVAILSPFLLVVWYGLRHHEAVQTTPVSVSHLDILGGILISMWNYMGWDNASTIAEEVDRPRRTYPLAMLGSCILVTLTYIIPVAALARTGISLEAWATGGWVDIARTLGGNGLAAALMGAGALAAVGSFNALVMSLSRLPAVMAEDGFLPKVFSYCSPKTGVPTVAVIVCSVVWGLCMGLGFERVVMLDVLLTGMSILLEFAALVFLRISEPQLERPYRVPGGLFGAVAVGIFPLLLIVATVIRNYGEKLGPINTLSFGAVLITLGPLLYLGSRVTRKAHPR
ncbi:MAG: APC family permease [Acidobacteriia bacterium]|nr:APC family permease [Terriglobia bacterium]